MDKGIGVLIVAGLFLAVLIPVYADLFRKLNRHAEFSGNVVNYDITFREFWYFTEKSIPEILEILSVPGTYEDHTYRFDRENMELSLTSVLLGDTTRYIVLLSPRDNGTQFQLYRKEGLHRSKKVGVDLVFYENFFCGAVLDAKPIPWRKE